MYTHDLYCYDFMKKETKFLQVCVAPVLGVVLQSSEGVGAPAPLLAVHRFVVRKPT
jgi:hypothetical protein